MPREAGDTDEPLRAWLMKRNQNRRMIGGQWSKRWVEINDERGRLHVGKRRGKAGTTVVRAFLFKSVHERTP